MLNVQEIKDWQPYSLTNDDPLSRARERMRRANQWSPWQMLGRRMAVGCVALEITQRCNLDCAYCYLSESSEALKDIPLEEVYRRIDMIFDHYGANTDVQVTGGDPTLRKRDELVAIVRYIRQKKMRSSLFTNGIKATRDLLEELCEAGLEDVAFHVDMRQERVGYTSEQALNTVREEYINRARGLPLAVIFNTTVSPGSFHEVPALVQFFIRHADVVRFASFQIGADTGRGAGEGVEGARVTVNPETMVDAIGTGANTKLNFNAMRVGPAACNSYAYAFVINGKLHDAFADAAFAQKILHSSANVTMVRAAKHEIAKKVASYFLMHPGILFGVVRRFAALIWRARRDFIVARGRIGKISFFIHNFMDAKSLERERCEACSFMVMTPEGPMSMCVHNAKRDDYLLVAANVKRENKMQFFNPVTGNFSDTIPTKISVTLTRKNARGRAKDAMLDQQAAE